MELNKIYYGDCLEVMKNIPDKSIDMILADLPYGTTACKWDTIIPFEPLWEHYKRIIKDNGAIVLTASQPFTSALVMSNVKMFKYEWIWEKAIGGNPLLCKKQPLKVHENVLIFYKKMPTYNPQMTVGKIRNKKISPFNDKPDELWGGSTTSIKKIDNINNVYYPKSYQYFSNADQKSKLHPTQKPVALFEYLIKTYTNEGDLVLDNTAGSGTTGVACKNTNRNFILIEQDEKYCEICKERTGVEIIKLTAN